MSRSRNSNKRIQIGSIVSVGSQDFKVLAIHEHHAVASRKAHKLHAKCLRRPMCPHKSWLVIQPVELPV